MYLPITRRPEDPTRVGVLLTGDQRVDWVVQAVPGIDGSDGAADLAVANLAPSSSVLGNTGAGLEAVWTGPEGEMATAVAWGDYDGDGDLDLAAAVSDGENRPYRNDAGLLTTVWVAAESGYTIDLAWGDCGW